MGCLGKRWKRYSSMPTESIRQRGWMNGREGVNSQAPGNVLLQDLTICRLRIVDTAEWDATAVGIQSGGLMFNTVADSIFFTDRDHPIGRFLLTVRSKARIRFGRIPMSW